MYDETVVNQLGHGLYLYQDTKILWTNESFAEIFGYQNKEILMMSYFDIVHPDDRTYLQELDCKFKSGKLDHHSFEIKGIKKDGSVIYISLINKFIQFEGKPTIIGSVIDISKSKKMELELKESHERYQTLVENFPFGIIVHQEGIIKFANPLALSLLGTTDLKDIIGSTIDSIVHPDNNSIVNKRIISVVEYGKHVPTKYEKFVRLDGREIDVEVKRIPIQLNGNPAVQVMFWDVTEKKKEEELIKYRAYHDTLTDLPNFHKFQLDLAEEFNEDRTFTILYIEVEGLYTICNTYGWQAGDLVLIKIGARLSGSIGLKGIVYRMEGAKFSVVFLGQKEEKEIRDIAESIAEIFHQPIFLSNTTVQVSPRIGVVFYPSDGVDIERLLRHAEGAINNAKNKSIIYKKYND